MPIDHDFVRVASDGSGKRIANVKQTDPDAAEVYLQKTVTWDPEDETDDGGMRVVAGRGQVDAEVTGTVTANAGTNLNTSALLTESTFTGRVGEVQASPTANTILARLKTIGDALAGTLSVGGTVLEAIRDRLPAALGAGGGLKVDGSGTALPVSGTVTATATNLDIRDLTSASDSVAQRGEVEEASATWDSGTANNSTITVACEGMASALIAVEYPDPDISGGFAALEASVDGGTTWQTLVGYDTYNFGFESISTLALSDLTDYRIVMSVAGYTHVRVQLTTVITGTGEVEIFVRASAAPVAPSTVAYTPNGGSVALGSTTDAAATGNGSLIGIVKQLRTLLNGGLPGSLGQQTMANSISVAVASDQSNLPVVGPGAAASPTSGNPVRIAGRSSNAIPTDVGADGDTTELWLNRHGAPVGAQAPHVGLNGDPWSLVHEAAQYTTTQTSAVLVAGGASEKLVVTKVQIQAGGTTAGTLQLYFGTGAYSRGTNRAIFDGEFAPSATLKPGVVMDGPFIAGTNGDDLMVTTSAAINPLTISVWYYVVT